MFLGRNGNGKPEDSCLGDTMGVGSSDIYFGDSREGYKLTDSLGLEYGAELGLYGFRVSGEQYEGIYVCTPGSASNGRSGGNVGGNPLTRVLGADNGLIIWQGQVVVPVEVVSVELGEKILGTVI